MGPPGTRSQNGRSSPSTSSSPGRVGQSARSTTRGSTIPFQRLLSRRSAMSWLSARAGARYRGGERKATPRERAPPAVTSVKRECSPPSPMAVTWLKREAGTSKSNLLNANLWIKDMALFADMNSVWNEWVDPQNPPARACVRADLARPEVLVEIMVTAVK